MAQSRLKKNKPLTANASQDSKLCLWMQTQSESQPRSLDHSAQEPTIYIYIEDQDLDPGKNIPF